MGDWGGVPTTEEPMTLALAIVYRLFGLDGQAIYETRRQLGSDGRDEDVVFGVWPRSWAVGVVLRGWSVTLKRGGEAKKFDIHFYLFNTVRTSRVYKGKIEIFEKNGGYGYGYRQNKATPAAGPPVRR